jgi:hypothetical protein
MGGKNAVIVCEDARFDLAVTAGILSGFKTTGQRCVSASRILVHESIMDRYAEAFVATAKRLRFGDPLDAKSFAGPVIHKEHERKILGYNRLAKEEGVKVLLDGGEVSNSPGCFLDPFVYRTEFDPAKRVTKEEVFGPHVGLIPFRTDEEAARIFGEQLYWEDYWDRNSDSCPDKTGSTTGAKQKSAGTQPARDDEFSFLSEDSAMARKPETDDWAEAKRLCHLDEDDIRMAKELGFKPATLIKNIPSPSQRWKAPVKVWIRERYEQNFGARKAAPVPPRTR